MNLVLLFEEDFISGTSRVNLRGRRLQHVTRVHRSKPGDRVVVGLENGWMGEGLIQSIGPEGLDMDITLNQPPPEPLSLNLILALPRPKVVSRVIAAVSSMGVKNIWLIHAKRVEKSYWHSPRLTPESIRKQLILGLEQAKDTIMPSLYLKKGFKPFVEDELPHIIQGTTALLAHPKATDSSPTSTGGPLTLIIGPEGGFIPYEVEKLMEEGCKPIHLGDRILRVETVLPFVIGRLFP